MLYFVGDTHFGHKNIIKYCDRPFNDIDQMNEVLIENWNNKIKPNDEVWHLGDFGFQDSNKIIGRLNGRIHLIKGNHDRGGVIRSIRHRLESIHDLKKIKYDGRRIVLCHYAMRVWDGNNRGSWHLFGHSHGNLPPVGKSVDVGVDSKWTAKYAAAYTPWSYEEVRDFMDDQDIIAEDFVD